MSRYGVRWMKEDVNALKKLKREYVEVEHGVGCGCRGCDSIRQMQKRAKNGQPMIAALNIKQIALKKKPLLNKTELLFKAELERRGHRIILCQQWTFRLGDGLSYRPDFVVVEYGAYILNGHEFISLTCYETKGPHRFAEKGIQKVKMAATVYPWIKWKLVQRNGKEWSERTIGQ